MARNCTATVWGGWEGARQTAEEVVTAVLCVFNVITETLQHLEGKALMTV